MAIKEPDRKRKRQEASSPVEAEVDVERPEKPPVPEKEEEIEELAPIERDVLEIAEKVLKLKRYEIKLGIEREETISPMVDKLFATCIAKLSHSKGYSREDLFVTIRDLERKKWIVTDERRTKAEILESDVLQGVLRLISENPGIHARDPRVQEELGITRNPFTKHIMTLKRFDLVVSKRVGRTANYYLKDFPPDLMDLCAYLQNDLARDVLQQLLDHPEIGVLDLARALDVFHGAVQYHLKKFRKLDLVDADNHVDRALVERFNAVTKFRKFNL